MKATFPSVEGGASFSLSCESQTLCCFASAEEVLSVRQAAMTKDMGELGRCMCWTPESLYAACIKKALWEINSM